MNLPSLLPTCTFQTEFISKDNYLYYKNILLGANDQLYPVIISLHLAGEK